MDQNSIYQVRPVQDLKDMLEQSSLLYGDKNAFLIKSKDEIYKEIKYRDFKHDVDAFGTALLDLGLKDSFIAVIGENSYEWCVTYLAVVNGTGTIVPLDRELPHVEIENLLTRSNASAIVFSGKYSDEIKELYSKVPSVKFFIRMDIEQDQDNFLSYKSLIKRGADLIASGNNSFLNAPVNAEKMSMLLFTSGTTGLAKGVMLSHKNICTDITSVCSVIYIDSNDSALSILPLHHTYECTCGFLLMIYNGCTISFNEGLKHIAKNLKETKPTILFLVPLILESMYKKVWDQASKKTILKAKLKTALLISTMLHKLFKIDIRKILFKQVHENIGGRVRLIISGAAAVDPRVLKGFRSMGIKVLQGYGLTECSPIVTVNREFTFIDDSAGQALPGVEVKIDQPGKDGIGEIIVKGDNVMLGYFENEEATSKVIKDSWFYTGDLATLDESGFVLITGRKKNVIVTKNGKNIFPEEVEAYLNKSLFIKESLVWGKDDEDSGEILIHAQIVPDYDVIEEKHKNNRLSEEEVYKIIRAEVKSANKSMPLYKHVREFTIRKEEFQKTTTKKIKRHTEKNE